MIEHLRGMLIHRDGNHVVLETGGVGYGLEVTASVEQSLPGSGMETRLWVYTVVREEEISLYGFSSPAEREVFEIMLGIGGVGPKLAMAIVSRFAVDQLIQIVMTGDVHSLKSVPGVGLKKAEKLLLELKGRVKRLTMGITPGRLAELAAAGSVEAAMGDLPKTPAVHDAVAALEALEVPGPAARRAVGCALELLGREVGTESLVREALRHRHG
jgi:Holliday junction DNA helicase RuvA